MRCEVGPSLGHIITKVTYVEPYVEEDEDSEDEGSFHSGQAWKLRNPHHKNTWKILSGIFSACEVHGIIVQEK